MYSGLTADEIRITGHGDDEINAYFAEPHGDGPFPGVVSSTTCRAGTSPPPRSPTGSPPMATSPSCRNLHHRDAPGASPDDAAAAARARPAVSRTTGSSATSAGPPAGYRRARADSNGKVGVIGYCSGGRQAFLAACSLDIDAAVDCYGAFVVGDATRGDEPYEAAAASRREPALPVARPVRARRPVPLPRSSRRPSRRSCSDSARSTNSTATKEPATPFSTRRETPTARRPPPTAGSASSASTAGSCRLEESGMCTYLTSATSVSGSGKGAQGWFRLDECDGLFRPPVPLA